MRVEGTREEIRNQIMKEIKSIKNNDRNGKA
jgi:hypothetical protein